MLKINHIAKTFNPGTITEKLPWWMWNCICALATL